MRLNLKSSDDGKFGFVETYKPYSYSSGAVSMRVLANAGGYIPEPYVFRKGLFVPAKEIEEEMGIEKYLKAKKPFYSMLGTGNVIVDMRVAYEFKTCRYLEESSHFKLFGIVKDTLIQDENNEWSVELRQFTARNSEIDEWLKGLAIKIASMGSDREKFLLSRIV